MNKNFIIIVSITLVLSKSLGQDCKDPHWCALIGARLCAINSVVARDCKANCGTCNVEIHCPNIERPEHADIRTLSRPPYRVGTVANFTCDPGFRRIGPSTITCRKTGKWSDSTPYCSVRICRKDPSKLQKGRKCGKKCKRDSNCRGSGYKCQCDDWCGKSCINPNEDCPQLVEPRNGYIVANGWTYGKTVTYGCDKGFTLAGASTRRCRSDRKWDGSPPVCVSYGACGQNGDTRMRWSDGKVTRGSNAKEGAWPWQALLVYDDDLSVKQIYDPNSGFAGGSIINEQWILTAAHVITDLFPRNFAANVWKNTFLIVLGMTKRPKRELEIPDHIQIFTPGSVIVHSQFDKESFDYDVALIRVGEKLKREKNNLLVTDRSDPRRTIVFSRLVRPACLPCMKGDPLDPVDVLKNFDKSTCGSTDQRILPKYAAVGSAILVTGFGMKSDETEAVPAHLQQGILELLDDSVCVASVRDIKRRNKKVRFTSRMFCATGGNETARVDSCKGDSGGPVVKRIRANKKKYWLQIGIVSWGVKCAGEYPGFYISVPSIMTWLWKTLDNAPPELVTCSEKPLPTRGHYNITSCPSEGFVGSQCSFQCQSGYKFTTGEKSWTATCQYNASDRHHAEWNFTDAPACEEIKCNEKTFHGNNYSVKSCPSGKLGTRCSLGCESGYSFGTGNIWTTVCELTSPNSLSAEWRPSIPPLCQECKEQPWCWRVQSLCKSNYLVRSNCRPTCGICNRGSWDQWTPWSGCSVTCGGGETTRLRSCQGPGACDGEEIETLKCNTQICPAVWSQWSDWGRCSVTCGGGERSRERSCIGQGSCQGNGTEVLKCNTPQCPGVWTVWSDWGNCSATCGGGERTRTRTCQGPGKCAGKDEELLKCNTPKCPSGQLSRADRLVNQIEEVLDSLTPVECEILQYKTDFVQSIKPDLEDIFSSNILKAKDRRRVYRDTQRVFDDQEKYSDQQLSTRYRNALMNYLTANVAYQNSVTTYENTLEDVYLATAAYSREFLKCESGSSKYVAALAQFHKTIGEFKKQDLDYIKAFYDYIRAHDNYCTCLQEVQG